MDIIIKDFTELSKEEVYKILKLRNEVFVLEQQCPYQDCDGKDIGAVHLLMKDNDEIIGYLRILNRGISYEEVSIGRVVVSKSYRGLGIGKKIMINAINYIKEVMGENEIRISAQLYLLNFYRQIGFIEVSEEYLEDDIPHIEMLYKE